MEENHQFLEIATVLVEPDLRRSAFLAVVVGSNHCRASFVVCFLAFAVSNL